MGKSNLRKSNHIMKKTLTAVAVLGALSGATLAADVTLYGVIDTGFTYQHTEGGDDSFAMTSAAMPVLVSGLKAPKLWAIT